MKIDLCKLLGVEEGEEFRLSKSDNNYRIYNNKLHYYDYDYERWEKSHLDFNVVANMEVIKLPKKKEFSQETLNFFKCINKKYKWIAKDMNDDVHTFCEKPIKESRYWFYDGCFYISKAFNQAIFNQILWEDEEPVYIDD